MDTYCELLKPYTLDRGIGCEVECLQVGLMGSVPIAILNHGTIILTTCHRAIKAYGE